MGLVNPFWFAPAGAPSSHLIEFIDGAEFYARQDDKWKGLTNSTAPAAGVAGAHGLVCDDSVWGAKNYTLVTPSDEVSCKFRVRFRVDTADTFASLSNAANFHLTLARTASDTLRISLPGGVTHDTVDTYAIDTWYEIELYVLVHDTTGAWRLEVDGVVPSRSGGGTMEGTGVDTKAGTATTVASVRVGSSTLDTYSDDHCIDITGTRIGRGQVETLRPTGAGDLTQLTRGGADSGANWSQVDENVDTGATDYNRSTASNQRDCYTFQSPSEAPKALQIAGSVMRHISGTFTFRWFLRIGGVNYDGTQLFTAGSGADIYQECWTNNPATGNAWQLSDFPVQAGILCIDSDVRLCQIVQEAWISDE